MALLADRDQLHRELAALRDRCDLQDEELRQYRTLLAPEVRFPAEWRLTLQESRVLSALYASTTGFRTKEALHVALSPGLEVETDEKLVDVIVHKVRKKLPRSVRIGTVWGEGYQLDRSSRDVVAAALGHPADPASFATFILETMAMSFDVITQPLRSTKSDATVLLKATKSGKPSLVVSVSAAFAKKASMSVTDRFNLLIGKGEKKGFLRFQKNESGGFIGKALRGGRSYFIAVTSNGSAPRQRQRNRFARMWSRAGSWRSCCRAGPMRSKTELRALT